MTKATDIQYIADAMNEHLLRLRKNVKRVSIEITTPIGDYPQRLWLRL